LPGVRVSSRTLALESDGSGSKDAQPPAAPTAREPDGSREQILAVAMKLFAKHGYAGDVDRAAQQGVRIAGRLHLLALRQQSGASSGQLPSAARSPSSSGCPAASNYDGDPTERLAAMLDDMAGMLGEDSAFLRLVVMLSTIEHAEGHCRARERGARSRACARCVARGAPPGLRAERRARGAPCRRRARGSRPLGAIGGFVNSEGDVERYRSVLRSFTDLTARGRTSISRGNRRVACVLGGAAS